MVEKGYSVQYHIRVFETYLKQNIPVILILNQKLKAGITGSYKSVQDHKRVQDS